MFTSTLEEVIDANADDILGFLERNTWSNHPNKPGTERSNGTEVPAFFEVERKGNIISIYAKPSASDKQCSEVIRFEAIQYTKTMSSIKAFYACSDDHFLLMFYRIWTRLAIAFATPFAGEALRKLRELEETDSAWEDLSASSGANDAPWSGNQL